MGKGALVERLSALCAGIKYDGKTFTSNRLVYTIKTYENDATSRGDVPSVVSKIVPSPEEYNTANGVANALNEAVDKTPSILKKNGSDDD